MPKIKIRNDQARIRELYGNRVTMAEIAKIYDVSKQRISQILDLSTDKKK